MRCTASSTYTAPLVKLVKMELPPADSDDGHVPHTDATSLAEDWPWWSVQEYSLVKDGIQSDPRWDAWVKRLSE
jgi:hypothetical protein